ncbi:MAG: endonuclease/exonuclease/phosphatase family protein [Bacteroidota bacterium]
MSEDSVLHRLVITYVNVQGLSEARQRQVQRGLDSARPDVFGMGETHLRPDRAATLVFPGYQVFYQTATGSIRGGLVVLVRNGLSVVHRREVARSSFEYGGNDVLLLQIQGVATSLFVGFGYRCPAYDVSSAENAESARRFFGGVADIAGLAHLQSAALVLAGDLNVFGVQTPRQTAAHRFPRVPSPTEGRHGLAHLFEAVLDDGLGQDLPLHVFHGNEFTRQPIGGQPGTQRQLDYVFGNDTALAMVVDGRVEDVVHGPYRWVASDHRPLTCVLRFPHAALRAASAPTSGPRRPHRRVVRWTAVTDTRRRLFRDGLDAAVAASGLIPRLQRGLAEGCPWRYFPAGVESVMAEVLHLLRHAEETHVGVAWVNTSRPAAPQRARWWSSRLEAAHDVFLTCRQEVVRRRHGRSDDNAGADDDADDDSDAAAVFAMDAAERDFESGCLHAQLALVTDGLLFAGAHVHEARRFHELFRKLTAGTGPVPTHVFRSVANSAGDLVSGDGVAGVLKAWMQKHHSPPSDSATFDAGAFADAQRRFGEWRRGHAAAECARTRAAATNVDALRVWEQARDAEMKSGRWDADAHTDWEFNCSIARDVVRADVAEALAHTSSGTATSPADDVSNRALKAAGPLFQDLLALLFSGAQATGDLPWAWTTGFIAWLSKTGSVLDPQNFRGICLTSLVGKLYERCNHVRFLRWIRYRKKISTVQSATQRNIDVMAQIGLIIDAAAVRYARRQLTFVVSTDLAKAFPSVPVEFAFLRFHEIGLRGVGLRFLHALLGDNAVCIGGACCAGAASARAMFSRLWCSRCS